MQKKKLEVTENLREIEEEKKALDKELGELDRRMVLALGTDNKPKSDADIKAYMRELQLKSGDYKAKKATLQVLKNEVGTLLRTEDILRSRDENLAELLQELEQKRGISGFLKTQESIEQVSSDKSKVDQEKGQTLEEMSVVVSNLMAQVKLRKVQLEPQVKNLKASRLQLSQIEAVYEKKKRIWDNTSVGLENERASLEQEVDRLSSNVARDESRYHLVQCLHLLNRVEEGRIDHEKRLQSETNNGERVEKVNGKYSSYRNMYEHFARSRKISNRPNNSILSKKSNLLV
jgi:intraflagellar transport protein 81